MKDVLILCAFWHNQKVWIQISDLTAFIHADPDAEIAVVLLNDNDETYAFAIKKDLTNFQFPD